MTAPTKTAAREDQRRKAEQEFEAAFQAANAKAKETK